VASVLGSLENEKVAKLIHQRLTRGKAHLIGIT
jgi:hypothetical protein